MLFDQLVDLVPITGDANFVGNVLAGEARGCRFRGSVHFIYDGTLGGFENVGIPRCGRTIFVINTVKQGVTPRVGCKEIQIGFKREKGRTATAPSESSRYNQRRLIGST